MVVVTQSTLVVTISFGSPTGEVITLVTMQTSTGLNVENPTGDNVAAVMEVLPRGGHLILDGGVENTYWQIWYRPNGTYQVEYRDGSPSCHYQTLTVSRDKVIIAGGGWLSGDESWLLEFAWKNIGDWFEDEDEG
ncbi:hypothetical protein [Amycolatopsis sp. NPDC001319]|uniref:hypothetical protein n=1 Tax=unclassified Amycolatopsis TaxID=2618356 RepID=UPI0036917871